MTTKIISLQDRLARLNANEAAHPEYDSVGILSMARMPIMRYLGNYETFCDFQCITEVKESLPYQMTARVIADQVWSPEDMRQILDMLAAPVVRIEEAYRQNNAALLPVYTPEGTVFRQEHLSTRLESLKSTAGPPYDVHRMPVQRFFRAASELTGYPSLLNIFRKVSDPYVPGGNALFREAVYAVNAVDTSERTNLLYKILIEPFAALCDAESEVDE